MSFAMMLNSTYNEVCIFHRNRNNGFHAFGVLFTTTSLSWILMTKLLHGPGISNIYIDRIGYKYYLETMIIWSRTEEELVQKTDWIVEWQDHQRIMERDMDREFIYTNTETNEEYVAGIDDGPRDLKKNCLNQSKNISRFFTRLHWVDVLDVSIEHSRMTQSTFIVKVG